MDKQKIKELFIEKKKLDQEQEDFKKRVIDWNSRVEAETGEKNIKWDDLLLKVLEL
jgi:hypothetical protein